MKLYDIIGGKVDIHADMLGLPAFKVLYDNDKDLAYKQISYIVLKNAWDSPYKADSPEVRDAKLRRELFTQDWEPGQEILQAEEAFNNTFQNSLELKVLNGLEKRLWDVYDYYMNGTDDVIMTDAVADKIFAAGIKAGNLISALSKVREAVMAKQTSTMQVRGGGEINSYEIPNKR